MYIIHQAIFEILYPRPTLSRVEYNSGEIRFRKLKLRLRDCVMLTTWLLILPSIRGVNYFGKPWLSGTVASRSTEHLLGTVKIYNETTFEAVTFLFKMRESVVCESRPMCSERPFCENESV